jgi:hypothetical protein
LKLRGERVWRCIESADVAQEKKNIFDVVLPGSMKPHLSSICGGRFWAWLRSSEGLKIRKVAISRVIWFSFDKKTTSIDRSVQGKNWFGRCGAISRKFEILLSCLRKKEEGTLEMGKEY